MGASDHDVQKVFAALKNDKYKWRTIRGVSKEAGVTEDLVRQVLKEKEAEIVQSSVPSTKGEDLFASRETFESRSSFGERMLGAFKGRRR